MNASAKAPDQPAIRSRFERHPKKTIAVVVAGILLLGLMLTEKLLNPGSGSPGRLRFINLREHRPYFTDDIYPTAQDLRHAEVLPRQKYRLQVDAQGYIMPSQVHPEPDLTIFFLGGSTTECLYMAQTARFPYLAGRLLEQDLNLKVNSFNAGKAGNNSLHSINILVNKVLPQNPDLVAMLHNINDLIILLFEGSYWPTGTLRSPIIERPTSLRIQIDYLTLALRQALVPHLAKALEDLGTRFFPEKHPPEFTGTPVPKVEIDQSGLLTRFRANLRLFAEICRQHRVTPVFLTQANRFKADPDPFIASMLRKMEIERGISYSAFKEIFDLFNQEIRLVGQAKGVPVIDLAAAIPQDLTFIYDTVHLTSQGSGLASEVIARRLAPVIREVMAHRPRPASN